MNYIIEGKKVGLTPLKREYIDLYTKWINNLEVNKFLTTFGSTYSVDKEEEWFESQLDRDDEKQFTIHVLNSQEPIGNCGLHQIDHQNRRATLGIMIGNPDYWDQGLGTESVRLVTDFGFTVLNFRAIYLSVVGFNLRAQEVYKKVGYRKAGQLRNFIVVDGQRYDLIWMDILRQEFYEQNDSIVREQYLDFQES